MTHQLKGDAFQNRYRITGTLTTASPLHIGTGEERLLNADSNIHVSTIITDCQGKPLIPGSTLRGVLRNWLLTILEGIPKCLPSDSTFHADWAKEHNYTDKDLLEKDQSKQIQIVKGTFSYLELLFGTPFNAGKVEVWDAICSTGNLQSMNDRLLRWDSNRLTYVDTSVAIDPARGTAKEKLLYKADVVPPGVTFDLNLVAQNLSDMELGLVLLGLEGFNSKIYPVQVGARRGRGYGQMKFKMGSIYQLDSSGVKDWIKETLKAMGAEAPLAGYFGLRKLAEDEQKQKIEDIKGHLVTALGG